MRKTWYLALSAVAVLMFACGGEKQAPKEDARLGEAEAHQNITPLGQIVLDVPESVRSRWREVVLVIEDKSEGTVRDYTVGVGKRLNLPGSDLSVEIKEFFPSFVMQGSTITSNSDEQNNPAAQVIVREGGLDIFKGWLFARYPATHAFSHPRYAITLKEGISAE